VGANKTQKTMNTHNNLTTEQKEVLGMIHSLDKTIDQEIFEFENSRYTDYKKLTYKLHFLYERQKQYTTKANQLEIPIENVRLFNSGVVTGLINPNRLSYVAFYE
jgi:uncharacterized protein YydD (DUF2326 family)